MIVIWWFIPDILCCFVQDTVLIIPPYPYNLEEDHHHDVPLEDMWYARPQLFFTCALRPKNGRKPKNPTYKTGPDDKVYTVQLCFLLPLKCLICPSKGLWRTLEGPNCTEYILVYTRYIMFHPWDVPLYTNYSQVTSEQWFIKFRLRKTMQCVWDVPPIRSKRPRLPQR